MDANNPLSLAISDTSAALASFVTTKKELTALLANVVNLFNAFAPHADQVTALTAYVLKFNEVTTASDNLRAKVANVSTVNAGFEIGLRNLTQEQADTIAQNPQAYLASAYLCMVNILFMLGQEQALAMADSLRNDMILDINYAFKDTSVVEVFPSVIYESDHALDLVNASFAALPPPDPVATVATP